MDRALTLACNFLADRPRWTCAAIIAWCLVAGRVWP